jgi:hypothetical protein
MTNKRTRPNSTKKSIEFVSSWLDLNSPASVSDSPSSHPKRHRKTLETQREDNNRHVQVLSPHPKIARINALTPRIDAIKASVDARQHIKHLTLTSGRYCVSCSPTHCKPGSCNPACPLLRPQNRGERGTLFECVDSPWIFKADEDKEFFEDIIGQMDRFGYGADERRVKKWEDAVGELYHDVRKGSKTKKVRVQPVPGLDLMWTFGGRA